MNEVHDEYWIGHPNYISPEEIAQRKAEVQASWSEEERARRWRYKGTVGFEIPIVPDGGIQGQPNIKKLRA